MRQLDIQDQWNRFKQAFNSFSSDQGGYTLVSTAIVIVGLGFLSIVGMSVYDTHARHVKIIESDESIQNVRAAFDNHINIHGKLPCPASMDAASNSPDFGAAVGGAGGCLIGALSGVERVTGRDGKDVLIGSIPTRNLNILSSNIVDSWGGRYLYAVTAEYTEDNADFQANNGAISLLDENGDSVTTSPGNAIYALVSPGENQQGARSIDGQEIAACDTATFSGENCDLDDAVFNISMNKSYSMGTDSFTDNFYYMASNDIYQWKVSFGNCACPSKTREPIVECYSIPSGSGGTDDGGDSFGGPPPTPTLVNDSFCPDTKPSPAPQDCSAEPQVNNCFGWYTPPITTCPCGTSISLTSTCNERDGNGGSIQIANVSQPLQCNREGDTGPVANPATVSCGTCPTTTIGPDGETIFIPGSRTLNVGDPLALDLDGDGVIEFRAINEGTMFDVDNDGNADYSSWVGPTDGLLAEDRNENGIIDGQSELFGNEEMLAFDHLAIHDSNDNNFIDADDDNYDKIIVWQDSNSDGISQASEMKSLDDWNIIRVDLTHVSVEEIAATNLVTGRGSFTRILDTGEEVIGTAVEFFLNMFNLEDSNS